MKKLQLKKRFRCNICDYTTNDIEILQDHCDNNHNCLLCSRVFMFKDFHSCIASRQVGTGRSVIQEPVDQEGNNFFHKDGQSFKDVISSYSYAFDETYNFIRDALDSIKDKVHELINSYVKFHSSIKLKISAYLLMYDEKSETYLHKLYPSALFRVGSTAFTGEAVDNAITYIDALVSILAHSISGLTLIKCEKLNFVIMKNKPRSGNAYLPAGPFLSNRQGLVNPRVSKNCFYHAALIALCAHEIKNKDNNSYFDAKGYEKKNLKRRLEKESTWLEYLKNKPLKHANLDYGDDLTNLPLFESANLVSCTIFKYSKKEGQVMAIRTTNVHCQKHINLLQICRSHLPKALRSRYKSKMHWAVILNASSFFRIKTLKYKGMCKFCGSLYRNLGHEAMCVTNANMNLIFPSNKKYNFTGYYRCVLPAFFITFHFLYAEVESGELEVIGYGLLVTDCDNNLEHSSFFVGKNAVDTFLNEVFLNAEYQLNKMVNEQLKLEASKEEREFAKSLDSCTMCLREINHNNKITIDHNHHSIEDKGKHMYICSYCNKLKYPKRLAYIYCHSLSKNAKYILSNLSASAFKHVKIIPQRTSNSILALIFKGKFVFVDFEQHISLSLYDLIEKNSDDAFYLMANNNSEMFSVMRNGLSFPTLKFLDKEEISNAEMPAFENFNDVHIQGKVNKITYARAQTAYNKIEGKNMHKFALLALKANKFGLQSVIHQYAKWSMNLFGCHGLFDFTLASFSFNLAHFFSKTDYETLRDEKIYACLNKSILGGLSFVGIRIVDASSSRLDNKENDDDDTTEILSLDFSSFYGAVLGTSIPYSDYYMYTKEEVEVFDFEKFNDDGDVGLIICCSLIYSDTCKLKTRWLPLCPMRELLVRGNVYSPFTNPDRIWNDNEYLNVHRIALNQLNKKDAWVCNNQLRLFIRLGMILTKITTIISFKCKPHLSIFVDKCIAARKNAASPLESIISKGLLNSTFGKFISRTVNERVVLCSSQKQAIRLLGNIDLVDAVPLTPNLMMVAMKQRKSIVVPNFFIGVYILMHSKYLIYKTYYYRIVPAFGEQNVALAAFETDMYVLRIRKKDTLMKGIAKLKDLLDMSFLPKWHPLYDDSKAHQPLLLKLEDIYILSFIGLRGKQRSIISLNPENCEMHNIQFCKQCLKHISKGGGNRAKILHDRYRAIVNGEDDGMCSYSALQKDLFSIKKIEKTQKCFSLGDGQRIFPKNSYESYPLGYPIPIDGEILKKQ